MIKVTSKLQTVILEERPKNATDLIDNPKFAELKMKDLLTLTQLNWSGETFELQMTFAADFSPRFEINLSSERGITSPGLIEFTGQSTPWIPHYSQ